MFYKCVVSGFFHFLPHISLSSPLFSHLSLLNLSFCFFFSGEPTNSGAVASRHRRRRRRYRCSNNPLFAFLVLFFLPVHSKIQQQRMNPRSRTLKKKGKRKIYPFRFGLRIRFELSDWRRCLWLDSSCLTRDTDFSVCTSGFLFVSVVSYSCVSLFLARFFLSVFRVVCDLDW